MPSADSLFLVQAAEKIVKSMIKSRLISFFINCFYLGFLLSYFYDYFLLIYKAFYNKIADVAQIQQFFFFEKNHQFHLNLIFKLYINLLSLVNKN